LGEADSILKLATEYTTKSVNDKIKAYSLLEISLNKIIDSIDPTAEAAEAPQRTHLQVIENIICNDPQLFNDTLIGEFFSIKNIFDSQAEKLPLNDGHKIYFQNLLEDVIKFKKIQIRIYRFVKWSFIILIFVILILALIISVEIAISKFLELMS
jgi:hypothetical protein